MDYEETIADFLGKIEVIISQLFARGDTTFNDDAVISKKNCSLPDSFGSLLPAWTCNPVLPKLLRTLPSTFFTLNLYTRLVPTLAFPPHQLILPLRKARNPTILLNTVWSNDLHAGRRLTIERSELCVGDAVALDIGDGSATPQKKINASILHLRRIMMETHPVHLALEDSGHSWQMIHIDFWTQHTGTSIVDVLIT